MSILILGDCHGAWAKLIDAIANGVERHGVTTVIQVGDFGFFPNLFPKLEVALAGRPFPVPVHVIDGNHEDHAWLWQQAKAGEFARWDATHNLIVHRRGDTALIEGVRVGFLGGALHADRRQHGSIAMGTTNWVTERDVEQAVAAFSTAGVDLLVSHSCPHSIGVGMQASPHLLLSVELHIRARGFDSGPLDDCGEPALRGLWAGLKPAPRAWVFGHFHAHQRTRIRDTLFRCVGSSDGSDGYARPWGHLLEPVTWTWSEVDL